MRKNQAGVSIIEVLAVLAIGAIILLLSFKAVRSMFSANELSSTRFGAERVMDATQAFFESHCGLKDNAQPSIAQLVADGFLKSVTEANSDLGGTFDSSIVWGVPPIGSRIIVSLTLPVGMNAAAYVKALGADRSTGQVIYWDDAPAMESRPEGNEVIEMIRMYQPGLCI